MALSVWAPGASSPLNKFSTPTFRYNGLLADPPYRNDRYPDPNDPDKWLDSVSPIPFGSAIALDFDTLHHGFGKWHPKPESWKYFVPVTDPFPSLPPDPDYKPGFKLLVGVRGFGVMNCTDLHGWCRRTCSTSGPSSRAPTRRDGARSRSIGSAWKKFSSRRAVPPTGRSSSSSSHGCSGTRHCSVRC
jgi:hypothetical protein